MHFKLEFDCDNAAFGETPDERRAEVASILRRVSAQLLDMVTDQACRTVRDTNGNSVGCWEFIND